MTRAGTRKAVDAAFASGRLRQARAYMKLAQDALILAEPGQNATPILGNVVLAAIAYGDCLTARFAGVVNSQDHAAAPRLLREVLRQSLPNEQEARYRRILAEKDAAQYGARDIPLAHVKQVLADLEKFANWAEDYLSGS